MTDEEGVIEDVEDSEDVEEADDDLQEAEGGGSAYAVLDYVARALVDEPDAVEIEVDERGGRIDLRLHVAPDDMGKVIGRRGRVVQAMRTLVRAAAARDGLDADVDVVD